MRHRRRNGEPAFCILAAILSLGMAAVAIAAEVDYLRDVKPLLKEKCGSCHGPVAQKAGLRLDAGELIRKGGDSGAAVDVENPPESELLYRVTAEDEAERMPPPSEGERLTASEVAMLREWIRGGAKSPDDEEILTDPRAHWAYQVPQRPPVPKVANPEWSANPIDAFIARKHAEKGLAPVAPADKAVLLRRAFLDLIGLPPTPDELHDFLADDSSDAYMRVVDLLLDSPHYGERWGRHWMDVWRYSDWDGFKNELRGSQRHIWRWRDWIVESLNADKGYDRMIVEMLAGDEIAPLDSNVLRATGFLARNFQRNRNVWLESVVEHTAKGFLGITLNCAKCHSHKYDPISQEEYYSFRAFFEPYKVRIDRVPGQADSQIDGLPRIYDAEPAASTFLYVRGDEKRPDKDHPLSPAIPQVFEADLPIDSVPLPRGSWYPALCESVEREDLEAARAKANKSREEYARACSESMPESQQRAAALKCRAEEIKLAALYARWCADKARYLEGATGSAFEEKARHAASLEREAKVVGAELAALQKEQAFEAVTASTEGDDSKKKAALDKAEKEREAAKKELAAAQEALAKPDGSYSSVGPIYPEVSSGRRTALANWIAARTNPLTARVAVNHIWLRHFGTPLVENVFDFGLNSPQPLHAGLLDWLAVEFMEHGWSMKHIHRLMVTSRTYRLSSSISGESAASANRAIDPENRAYWCVPVRRLEAELIRDSVLAVAGALDRTIGGPDIEFAEGERVSRRSLYFQTAYEKQMQFLELFDGASPMECYRRTESVIPQQALALANSSLSFTQSRKLARDLARDVSQSSTPQLDFVRQAYVRILSRRPTHDEEAECLAFLKEQTERLSQLGKLTPVVGGATSAIPPAEDPAARAAEGLIHVLLNHNDFVTVR